MAQVFGIDNLKKLVKFACDLTKQITESLADGWQWTDALAFIDEITAIPGVIKSFPAIKQELGELSPQDRQDLYAYVVAEFDIPNDKVEAFVENSLLFAVSAVALVEQWKALKTPPVTPP